MLCRSLSAVSYSQDFARTVLDSIIKNYFATYGEKYINQQTLPNNNVRGTDGQYDYIERVEILDAWALNISDYLAAKKETQPNYRSAETGYSFSDLYEIYKSYIDIRYSADLFAYIGTRGYRR